MKIFEYQDYRQFLKDWVQARPKAGRGEMQKMANHLGLHSTMISHVFSGKKELSLEQALSLSSYLGLNDLEQDYFITLIQISRAGTHQLKTLFIRKLSEIKNKSEQIKNRLPKNVELKEEDKGIFYSSWLYSALRMLSTIPKFQERSKLVTAFSYSPKLINQALDFLLQTGLCQEKNGHIEVGPSKTHLSQASPHIWKHHQNWRLKAMERHQRLEAEELIFSSPLTISRSDMETIREKIVQLIEELSLTVDTTEPEQLACLNIDWVKII